MEEEPTSESINNLIDFIEYLRKYYENLEEYENAAEMRDLSFIFGNYQLGYSTYSDVETVLYDFCCQYAAIEQLDIESRYVLFDLSPTGNKFIFYDVKRNEMKRLALMKTTDEELKNQQQ